MKIVLEIDPLPQTRPRFSKGRCYENARISEYKKEVGYAAKKAMAGVKPTVDALKVSLKFWRKFKATSRRFADCDNLAKAVLDALSGIVWNDDAQVVSLTAEKKAGNTENRNTRGKGTAGRIEKLRGNVPAQVFQILPFHYTKNCGNFTERIRKLCGKNWERIRKECFSDACNF